MMKKYFAVFAALTLLLSLLAACGNQDNATGQDPGTQNGSTQDANNQGGSQDTNTQDGSQGTGSQDGAQGSGTQTPGGDDSQSGEAPDLAKFYEDFMTSLGEEQPAMMDANEDESYVDSFFPGLNDYELKQSVLQMAMISAVAFEIDLVECANENDVEAVKGIFQARMDNQIDGGAFYPETTKVWQNGEVLVNGNVVALIVAGDSQADAVAQFKALF